MTTDITELAQRMKAAAEKLDADQWQTRKGFSGIEVIVKGSLEKGTGCVSFQPVAADIADTKTARAIALFNPANVLALVEALEKAQRYIEELREWNAGLAQESFERQQRIAETNLRNTALTAKIEPMERRIAELESRTVKLPAERFCPAEYAGSQLWSETEVWNNAISTCAKALTAAGIKWEAE